MISFDADRWKAVQENYDAWWAGTSPRPLAGAAVRREDAPRLPPPITQANCTDWGKSPRELVDAIDAYLSTFDYWGDAYPVYSMDCFGPGVAAAMLGAKVDNATGRVWFLPGEQKEISELHFEFDPHNRWFLRLRELYLTAAAHFRGNALLSIPALKAVQWVPGAEKPNVIPVYTDDWGARRRHRQLLRAEAFLRPHHGKADGPPQNFLRSGRMRCHGRRNQRFAGARPVRRASGFDICPGTTFAAN